jgi:hypothetical protein
MTKLHNGVTNNKKENYDKNNPKQSTFRQYF